ncbi:MAG: sulfatase-like hydrolase/transferase [Caldilineaceae bacterium]|nr:sulfatase-like hydrolase/transferase [Caldilineaceae bacterium]
MGNLTPPNILWITTDQQRFDTLGCYENDFVHTPNIDRLAEQGFLFENAFSQSPVCSPSRASFLTGRYPRTARCRQNGQTIPPDERMVTKLLKEQAGYVCGLSGKLHTAPCEPSLVKGTEQRIDDGYDEFNWSHDHNPVWGTNQYTNWLTSHGQVYRRDPYKGSTMVQAGMPEDYHQTTWCAEKAINFIRTNADKDAPWLFSVNIFDPHHPFDPPVEYLERYLEKLDQLPLPDYVAGELATKPHFQRMDHVSPYNGLHGDGIPAYEKISPREHRLIKAAYYAMIDLIDVQVGRMLQALEETGQLDNTIVIFMSDHGEMLGDHGIYLKGPYFYEGAIHVPLIFSQPGVIRSGVRQSGLTELVDIAPTLLEAAGVARYPGMQGRSMWKLLTGQGDDRPPRDDVYCEYYNAMPWHQDPTAQTTMVRTVDYKLIVVHGLDTGELYDLRSDPRENVNHWDDPDYQTIKLEMMKRLCDRMAWTVDPLPVREADW